MTGREGTREGIERRERARRKRERARRERKRERGGAYYCVFLQVIIKMYTCR